MSDEKINPKPKISAVIITLNEEKCIGRALQSVSWCDEIVVVDSFSQDATGKICQEFGCRFFQRPFKGYGDQKRFAVAQARNDWIFTLDADEEIPAPLREEILRLFSGDLKNAKGFLIPRTLIFLDKRLTHYSRFEKPNIRLFNRQHGNFNANLLHEFVELNGRAIKLSLPVWHHSYESVFDYVKKFNQYTTLGAEAKFQSGKRSGGTFAFLRFPLDFFKVYFLHQSFRDGFYGFVWSLVSSVHPVIKYLKLAELSAQHSRPGRSSA